MEYRAAGHKYKELDVYNTAKHTLYNYKKNGILSKVMSPVIYNTKNTTTKLIVDFLETVTFFLLSYVDELKYFKDYNFKRY